jgi:hypothetical protein
MLRALRIEYLGAIYQWPTVCNRPKTKVNRTTNMNSALCKYSGLTPFSFLSNYLLTICYMNMNFALSSKIPRCAHFTFLLIMIVGTGCGDSSPPSPKVGVQNWKPQGIGGPLEVRPLPPSDMVAADYEAWLESETTEKARVYEVLLNGASNQVNYTVEVRKESTPMGQTEHTYISFIYKDSTNGSYEFSWHRLGHFNADFMKLGDLPKVVWVRVNKMASHGNLPLLEIKAFEGIEPGAGVIAEPGLKLK